MCIITQNHRSAVETSSEPRHCAVLSLRDRHVERGGRCLYTGPCDLKTPPNYGTVLCT